MPPLLPQFVRTKATFSMFKKDVLLETFRVPGRDGRESFEDDFLLFGAKSQTAVVLPVTTDNKVVVLRHFRYATRTEVYELPGGTEEGCTDLDTARQELTDETGYTAEAITQIAGDTRYWFDPASCKVGFTPLLATRCKKTGEPKKEPNEFFETQLVDATEWLEMIFNQTVVDSKSITTTLLALPYLEHCREAITSALQERINGALKD